MSIQAFPNEFNYQNGMTLRDYFAGIAMHGMLVGRIATPDSIPTTAYEFADAMIEQREKK